MDNNQIIRSLFHPLVARWFMEDIGDPTELQRQAWPRIASGEHVLISAPTGSGKTFAAFLWAINQLITGKWDLGHVSVLYISPLRALNNDIQRNLLKPLGDLKRGFEREGKSFPNIRVLTRSGDTSQSDRRRIQHHPPEVLITTPESLNLLLSSAGGRSILTGISTVIMDEIHAVINTKRGVHLITAVDRLVPLSGEFQRIGLSATIKPLQRVAEFVGGWRIEGSLRNPSYFPRPVSIVESKEKKEYRLEVRCLDPASEGNDKDTFWNPFVDEIKKIVRKNSSTLLFANSRRLCEKLTYLINQGESGPVAYAHHGSLSREIREEVERKLKAGELRAIVATNSLELGIDIGVLDEVVLIQSPPSISSAIQRIGRAGHQVGEVSCGTLFSTHPQDLLEAAVLAPLVLGQDIESTRPVESPLDVLAQVVISMTGVEAWDMDRLYGQLKASYPYQSLSKKQFDLVLNMLAGRYADSRVRELRPRVSIDRMDQTVEAKKEALMTLYLAGGTIPDRGYFHIRHLESGGRIGELDEEFVWEASVGQTFTLGTQNWRIERITHNDVFVLPAGPRTGGTPFWKGEENGRKFHFSERIGQFLEKANDLLDDPKFGPFLMQTHCMQEKAAERLISFLRRQKETTGRPLPHRHHLLVEFVSAGPGGYPGNQVVLHTIWGGRVNRPFALAFEAAWQERFGHHLEVYVSNECIMLLLPHDVTSEEMLSLVTGTKLRDLLRRRLEGSGFFGARFRECAGRALLMSPRRPNERTPLWLSRLRSQKLLDSVLRYRDFPILLETWRTCLKDEFDLDALLKVLAQLEAGSITWSETRTHLPSPMARSVTWQQINQYMYMNDKLPSGKASLLHTDLLRDVAFTPELRPSVPLKLVEQFEQKRKRLTPGYSPDTRREFLDWIKERVLVPYAEWRDLLRAIQVDHGTDPETLLQPIDHKLVEIFPHGASESLIASREVLPKIIHKLYGGQDKVHVGPLRSGMIGPSHGIQDTQEPEGERDEVIPLLLGEWLQFYGPKTVTSIQQTLGLDMKLLQTALQDLIDSESIVSGQLLKGSKKIYVCDGENFETLLRLMRSEARPTFKPYQIDWLPVFLARYQGIIESKQQDDGLLQRIEQLVCYPTQAELWESEIFPARVESYDPSCLDSLIQHTELRWVGRENRRVCFYFGADLDLMQEELENHEAETIDTPKRDSSDVDELFPDKGARYDFSTLLKVSGSRPAQLVERLWRGVWEGKVTNDTFISLRQGIATGFKVTGVVPKKLRTPGRRRLSGRTAFSRWKETLPYLGNWQQIHNTREEDDLLEMEERNKDRARVLLDRYGIVFRELLQNELPAFRWSAIFRSLRLMELSGEVLTGYFFHGVPGPQFVSHEAFRMLQRRLPEDMIYWINAADPASLCGIRIDILKGALPRRVPTTHLVYRGEKLVLVSKGNGKTLTFNVSQGDPHLQEYFGFFRHLLTRQFRPLHRIAIEAINGELAAKSPYVHALRTSFDVVVDYKKVILYGKEI